MLFREGPLASVTVPENRHISQEEAAIVCWLLRNASVVGDLSRLESSVTSLQVVGRCGCGCPSVDFAPGGQASDSGILAEAFGESIQDELVGLILWGTRDAITGLEMYGFEKSAVSMPAINTLEPRAPA